MVKHGRGGHSHPRPRCWKHTAKDIVDHLYSPGIIHPRLPMRIHLPVPARYCQLCFMSDIVSFSFIKYAKINVSMTHGAVIPSILYLPIVYYYYMAILPATYDESPPLSPLATLPTVQQLLIWHTTVQSAICLLRHDLLGIVM